MRKRLVIAGAAIAASVAASTFLFAQQAQAAVGIHVSGTSVLESNGNNLVMRGTSHAHTWYTSQTSSFANIKSLGANAVRVVLSGGRWSANSASDVANVISLCKENKLICVLEDHDTTGYGEDGAAYTLDQAVDYWTSIKDVLVGEEEYIIINIGNEPYGNTNASAWTEATASAITAMRDAGFEHALMVDAPNWGQDWEGIMRDNAATVAEADPNGNTIFSIHMYGVYDTAAEITSYISAFQDAGLPLVIGEFGNYHSDGDVDEDTVMATAVSEGIGYFGWSWSGNSSEVSYLDQVTNFDPTQLSEWGERLFNGDNGIVETSVEATVFSGQTSSPTASATQSSASPTTSTTTSASASATASSSGGSGTQGCSATYAIQNSWESGFQGEVMVTAGSSSVSGWTVTWTFADGQTISQAWNATVTSSGSTVTATNVSWNGSLSAQASTSFGFLASWNGTNSVPSVSCSAS